MDPPAANQKRKRGRPTNALRDDEVQDASKSTTTTMFANTQANMNGVAEGDALDEQSQPRKRGRRTKEDVPPQPQPEPSETQPRGRRRRQASDSQIEGSSTEQASGPVPSKGIGMANGGKKRKLRQAEPPEAEPEEADDENENEDSSNLLRRSKRHRRSLDNSPVSAGNSAAQGREVESSKTERAVKKRKQPTQRADREQHEEEAEPRAEDSTTTRTKKKGKRPRGSQDAQSSMNKAQPDPVLPQRKRGRPPRSEGSNRDSGTGPPNESSRHQEEAGGEEPQVESRRRRSSAARRKLQSRRRSSEDEDQSPARSSSPNSVSSPPPYRYITERTRRVTHEVIESKWSNLDPSSLANIRSLLHSISLPTLLHVAPKQYAHAEDILEKVIRGLCKRSARLPFPPASSLPRREDELDFERTQSAVEVLLSQLDPLQHSVELLKREKERAEKDLEREYKVLDRLSTNARAEARERRDRLRKVHVLVPTTTQDSVADGTDLLPIDKAAGQVFTNIQDEEMLSLAGQINNHMDSMRGNLEQIDGILPAIAESHALLRTALQPQFDQKQLENIMLGQVVQ
ncbi:hypothetical protein NUW58_g7244 [Xylaria curta]|uniref:Uncharacterized protein n=1 Tax=Xylaria curta TaxID=42375 RepID=A0ACC1NKD5_9PEZI|nr:hypothetical protein NUW58_g7244 [Xylaria curta]